MHFAALIDATQSRNPITSLARSNRMNGVSHISRYGAEQTETADCRGPQGKTLNEPAATDTTSEKCQVGGWTSSKLSSFDLKLCPLWWTSY